MRSRTRKFLSMLLAALLALGPASGAIAESRSPVAEQLSAALQTHHAAHHQGADVAPPTAAHSSHHSTAQGPTCGSCGGDCCTGSICSAATCGGCMLGVPVALSATRVEQPFSFAKPRSLRASPGLAASPYRPPQG